MCDVNIDKIWLMGEKLEVASSPGGSSFAEPTTIKDADVDDAKSDEWLECLPRFRVSNLSWGGGGSITVDGLAKHVVQQTPNKHRMVSLV
jgi:hypothetical protein